MSQQPHPPPTKVIAFWVVALIPLLTVLLLEGILRASGYGEAIPLVVKKTVAGKEFLAINRDVGKRYFRTPGITVPEPSEDTFEITKPTGGKRIFCHENWSAFALRPDKEGEKRQSFQLGE